MFGSSSSPLLLLLLIVARRLYRPLIGGPSWLKIHQVLQLQEGGKVAQLDFVPRHASNPVELLRLLLGGEVEGTVRLRCNYNGGAVEEESNSSSRLCLFLQRILPTSSLSSSSSSLEAVSGFSTKLHLYNNNCVHFIDFFLLELQKESKS